MGYVKGNWVDTDQNAYWRSQWMEAWNVMPRHSATLLLQLIGSYKIYGPKEMRTLHRYDYVDGTMTNERIINVVRAYNYANNTVWANMQRGSKPKCYKAQRNLQAIATHGRTMALALAIKRKIPFK